MQIILKMTTACNLKCVYCSEGDQPNERMSKKIFFKVVDELPELLEHISDNKAEFLFHGGEPMLYGQQELTELIEYARKRLSNCKFLMQTNGTLINDDWIKFFKEQEIELGISLDGYPELHDKNRLTKDNQPTSQIIMNNLNKLKVAGIKFGTLMVMNDEVDDELLFKFIKENDLQPKIHSVINCGRAEDFNTKPIYKSYVGLMKKLFKRAMADESTKIIQPLDETMNTILGLTTMKECSYNGSCGKSFIAVYPDGEVGFCGRDNLSRRYIYGNVKSERLINLYESANAKLIRERQKYLQENDCYKCEEWNLCHGGCAYEAVNSYGILNAKYENCAERKEFLKWLKSEGLKLLKQSLIRAKTKHRESIKIKRKILNEIDEFEVI